MPSAEELTVQLGIARAEIEQLKLRNTQLEAKIQQQVESMGEVAERLRATLETLQ